MTRLATSIVLLGLLAATGYAEDEAPAGIEMVCYGVPARDALTEFAGKAKLNLDLGEIDPDMDAPVWLSMKQVSPQRGAAVLAFATGLVVQVSADKVVVREHDDGARLRVTRGYDVSVLSGRFVEYAKRYGHPQAGKAATRMLTSAELVGELVDQMLSKIWSVKTKCSVVGDRVLITEHEWVHAYVAELLNLLVRDGGAESADLAFGRTHASRVEEYKESFSVADRPLGSVVAALCREASADFVVHHTLAQFFAEEQTVLMGQGGHGRLLRALIRQGEYDFQVAQRHGVLAFVHKDAPQPGAYRVFDVDQLLKRIDQGYQRQATPGGHASLRDAGGVSVVKDALAKALAERELPGEVLAHATRIVVIGNSDTTAAAAAVLKELGWEPPSGDKDR
jgi:hypothetical protein